MAGSGRGQRRGERERERASHVYGDLNYNILGPNLDVKSVEKIATGLEL